MMRACSFWLGSEQLPSAEFEDYILCPHDCASLQLAVYSHQSSFLKPMAERLAQQQLARRAWYWSVRLARSSGQETEVDILPMGRNTPYAGLLLQ